MYSSEPGMHKKNACTNHINISPGVIHRHSHHPRHRHDSLPPDVLRDHRGPIACRAIPCSHTFQAPCPHVRTCPLARAAGRSAGQPQRRIPHRTRPAPECLPIQGSCHRSCPSRPPVHRTPTAPAPPSLPAHHARLPPYRPTSCLRPRPGRNRAPSPPRPLPEPTCP